MKFQYFTSILLVGALLSSCGEQATQNASAEDNSKTEVAEAEFGDLDIRSFVAKEGDVSIGNGIAMSSSNSWLEYEIDVPHSGRYKVEFSAAGKTDSSMIWIEDHVHNTDDRTYNITSNISVPVGDEPSNVYRDGSPMREGTHSIRIHLMNGVALHSAKFTLLKHHQVTPVTMTQKMDGENWNIVWSDEFDGSGIPDTSKWTYDIGNWGWGNGELQYFTENRTENARQEDGNLIIEAIKNDQGFPWTSARLTTRGKTAFLYGKLEFRAKVPAEMGNWAAGWTLGDKYVDELSWPYCGEIDILESVGYQMDNETGNGTAHASAHCGAYYFKLGNQPTGTTPVENMNNEFHTYGVVWTPESITAYVDDKEYFTYDDTSSELSWPFNQSQNLILNLTMGGGWGGLQGMDESVERQQMVIDYVRVYERAD